MIELKPTNNPLIVYKNKTAKYLKPCLSYYLNNYPDFYNLQKVCHPIAYGIGDTFFDDVSEDYKENIIKNNKFFIMLDLNGVYAFNKYSRPNFYKTSTIEFVSKYQRLGVIEDFYPLNSDVESNFWIITIKIPDIFGNILEKFLKGEYSKMFTHSQIEDYIKKYAIVSNQKFITDTWQVLKKDNDYRRVFQSKLIKEFRLRKDFEIEADIELDMPPKLLDEVFNMEYYEMANELKSASYNFE